MRQVVLKDGEIKVEEYPVPSPGPGEVLIKNYFSLISAGTERTVVASGEGSPPLRLIKNTELVKKFIMKLRTEGLRPALKKAYEKLFGEGEPISLGYSCAGVVEKVGGEILDIVPGMRVAAGGAGYASHAEYVRVPRNLVAKVPDEVPLKHACFATVGSIAMHGLRRANPSPGETFIIYGLGLLGLLGLQIARAWGLKVIGIDIKPERIELAKKLGAHLALTPQEAGEAVLGFTDNFGADASVIYASTTSSEPVNLSMDLLRQKGRVIVVGDVGMNISREKMYRKEIDLFMSTSYGPGRYDPLYEEKGIDYPIGYVRWTENRNMEEFLFLLKEKKIQVEPIITGVFDISSAKEAFEELSSGRGVGILFSYAEGEAERKTPAPSKRKVIERGMGIAFVGPGSFARISHLPNLSKFKDFFIPLYLVGRNHLKLKELCREFGYEKGTTDLEEVLEDERVKLVFISTPHSLHAEQAVRCLKRGKDVFVEKPLCVNYEELNLIRKTLEECKGKIFVGFNRRYSPLSLELKNLISSLKGPCHILYRVNAGYLPPDHWIHKKEEGGRLLGEGCHFIDYFLFLTGSEVEEIQAIAVPPDGKKFVEPDSFTVNLLMRDGSLCTLFYTSRGNTYLAKEYVEVHTENISAVMDNYIRLSIYGNKKAGGERKEISLKYQNKGLEEEIKNLMYFYEGKENSMITNEECLYSSEITLRAKEILMGD